VRLAVELEDFAYVKIGEGKVPVRFSTRLGREELHWQGEVLRSEGRVDRSSRSVFLVARVSAKDGEERAGKFLVPGLFVRAEVDAGVLTDVFQLPRKALYGKDRILIVDSEDRVAFRQVKILRASRDQVVIGEGIEPGERVAISPLPQVIDNMKVSVREMESVLPSGLK